MECVFIQPLKYWVHLHFSQVMLHLQIKHKHIFLEKKQPEVLLREEGYSMHYWNSWKQTGSNQHRQQDEEHMRVCSLINGPLTGAQLEAVNHWTVHIKRGMGKKQQQQQTIWWLTVKTYAERPISNGTCHETSPEFLDTTYSWSGIVHVKKIKILYCHPWLKNL